jgi:nicotinate-nucleotide pyrophosphorylase (carboxylating)
MWSGVCLAIPRVLLHEKLLEFLKEDVGNGDITTESIVPFGMRVKAHILTKASCTVAGLTEIQILCEILDLAIVPLVRDGDEVSSGTVIAEIVGEGSAILTAERTMLNLLTRMSGIATSTRQLLKMIKACGPVIIAATRKTAPGLRYFDKRSVAIGGGDTHRFRLDDAVLIKDNHIAIAGGLGNAIKNARQATSFIKKIEVEVRKPEEVLEAAKLGVEIIMMDNMTPKGVEDSIRLLKENNLRDKVLLEVSGNIKQENVSDYAKLRPDIISLGTLTHSVKIVDMSLEIVDVL